MKYLIVILFAAICIIVFAGCNGKKEVKIDLWRDKESIIKTSLQRLMSRTNEDCFVILTNIKTGEFVQFTQNDGALIIDLPEHPLNDRSLKRAVAFFRKYDTEIETSPMYSVPDNEIIGEFSYFQKELAHNYDLAFELAVGVFAEVFHFSPDFEMSIREN